MRDIKTPNSLGLSMGSLRGGAGVVVAVLGAGMLSGCALIERTQASNEARQLAWTGPGAGPCLFGGVTPRADTHCSMVSWGPDGVIYAVNEKVLAHLGPDADCQDHVELARAEIARVAGLRTDRIYSCPLEGRARNECHVSLLVTLADGERWVMDNRSVIGETVGMDGVTTLANFARQVEGTYWVGFPPSTSELATLDTARDVRIATRRR